MAVIEGVVKLCKIGAVFRKRMKAHKLADDFFLLAMRLVGLIIGGKQLFLIFRFNNNGAAVAVGGYGVKVLHSVYEVRHLALNIHALHLAVLALKAEGFRLALLNALIQFSVFGLKVNIHL